MAAVDKMVFPVALGSVLGCGSMAGLFCAFSNFVMRSFARLPPAQGLAAMQSINTTILNPLFLSVFMGTALLCVVTVIFGCLRWREPGMVWLCVGGALYLVGTFLVTMVGNVPLNDALAAVTPESPNGASVWADYLVRWTAWNHVRSVTSLAATAAFALALYFMKHSDKP